MKGQSFLYLKNTATKSKNRTTSESTCLVMKKDNHFPFTKKFYGRYQDLIEKYRRSVNAMVSDSFPGQFLFNM